MKRMFAMLSLVLVLAVTAFAQVPKSSGCCGDDCCGGDCCQSK